MQCFSMCSLLRGCNALSRLSLLWLSAIYDQQIFCRQVIGHSGTGMHTGANLRCYHDYCNTQRNVRLVQLYLMKLEQRCLLGSCSAEARLAACVACNHHAAVEGSQLDGYHRSVEQGAGCGCSAALNLPDVLVWPRAQSDSPGGPAFP